MKCFNAFSLLLTTFLFFSCNNASEGKPEPTTNAANTSTEESIQISSNSNTIVIFEHQVDDFENWQTVFNSQQALRTKNGLSVVSIGRGIGDPSIVYVTLKAKDSEAAKEFSTQTETIESMKKAGVVGSPMIHLVNIFREEAPEITYKEKLIVEYHVKDFKMWLNAYDAKEKKWRVDHGMIDRAIGYSVRDTNDVYLFFDVSDISKAQHRLASKEFEEFMKDSGRDGTGMALFYKLIK